MIDTLPLRQKGNQEVKDLSNSQDACQPEERPHPLGHSDGSPEICKLAPYGSVLSVYLGFLTDSVQSPVINELEATHPAMA
jgi:hypothetical protein